MVPFPSKLKKILFLRSFLALLCQYGALLCNLSPDLRHAAKVLRLSEPLETVLQADGVRDGGQVEGDVPERVDGGGDSLAHLAHHVALQLAREDGVHDAGALRGLDVGAVDEVPVEEVQQRDEELVRVLLSAVKRSIGSTTGCTITEKAPTRAFS